MSDQPAPSSATSRALRPTLKDFGRSNSFLKEHQQYRAPATATSPTASAVNHPGIDSVVEESAAMSSTISAQTPQSKYAFNGIPVKGQGVISSGIEHSLSHENCVPPASNSSSAAGAPDKLIATLFYHGAPKNGVSSPAAAPAASMAAFPLEPPFPAQDAEQLDHIYGSYVSPLCTAAFLHLMSSFPLPAGVSQLASSHRCLDNQERPRVVEFTLTPAPSPELLSLADLRKHEQIYGFEREWGVEVVLQYESLWRRHPRLVVFDMDATLITQEVIDLLAAATIRDPPDLAARVAEITERAMRGELQFDSAFRERVKLLAGLSADIFVQLRPVIDVTKGVPQLVRALKRLGVKTAVLSGGVLPLTGWLAGELGLDYAHANEVVIDPATNTLTGEVLGKIVGPERKRELLIEIAEKEKVDMTQVVACGDGANDLLMLEKAGLLGVAWNAKPKVQMAADARLNSESMLDMLYLFGFTSADIEALIA